MTDPQWLIDGRPHMWLPYQQMKTAPAMPAAIGAEGARIRLHDGRELIDGVSSWWTACHGYNHPHIRQAVETQLHKFPHLMLGGFANEPAFRLAKRLADLLPGDLNHVFLVESGSVSVEVAMKMAMQYWLNTGVVGRTKFISFKGGYHGDTLGTMSVCDPDEGMHSLFEGALLDQHVIALPTDAASTQAFENFVAAHAQDCAAIMVEPLVQGAGGFVMHDATTLQTLRRVADEHGLLLIFDEIMTGFGRLGPMFVCADTGVLPDIITLSKALSGGTLPLAAAIASAKVYDAFYDDDPMKALMHGPTYMANALACAAANASLDLFESEPRLEQVATIEAHLNQSLPALADMPGVTDIRIKGALGVVEVEDLHDVNWLKSRFIEEGAWIRPFGRVIYVMPPFVISGEELSHLTTTMARVIAEWSDRHYGARG